MADGLAGRIPGLAMHRSGPVEAPPVADPARVIERLLCDAIATVGEEHPKGALQWLRENRRDVVDYLRRVEADLDAASVGKDVDRVRKILGTYLEGYRRAFALYEARPVNVQGGLFK